MFRINVIVNLKIQKVYVTQYLHQLSPCHIHGTDKIMELQMATLNVLFPFLYTL
jgi:hypothetical protein